ncbi:MAG: TonB-dependent receptor [Bryobacter sp.]|nr:TonB-dependent receptor [Bryobacter sp.]
MAATNNPFAGRIVGMVKNSAGIAQMGASVTLLNRFETPLETVLTDEKGNFRFEGLLPQSYAVRVSLATFVPALRRNIQVSPGVERFLSIQMATLFSSVEMFYAPPPGTVLMSEEWKAALRSSLSSRPILRSLPGWSRLPNPPAGQRQDTKIFSDTRGMLRLAGGEAGIDASTASQTDLGTAFAVATSLWGRNQVQVSGNLGYGTGNGVPMAGFRTSFQREAATNSLGFDIPNPQVSVTMRQIYLPMRAGFAIAGGPQTFAAGAPALRTLSATVVDRYRLTDDLLLEYGSSLDSVQFIERLNYLSPYARLTWDGKALGMVRAAYSSGLPPVELLVGDAGKAGEMQREVSTLALFPRITRRGGTTQAQRVENFELSYAKKIGSGEAFATVYREGVKNAALPVLGAPADLLGQELVPDLGSNASLFNIGAYHRNGLMVGWSQKLGGDWLLSSGAGIGGVLRTDQRTVELTDAIDNDAQSLRNGIRRHQRQFASLKVSGTVPVLGTRIYSSYLWTDYRSLTPYHASLTGHGLAEAGLNLGFRQPVPGFWGMGRRFELNAELRNMLAQGYLPVTTSTGQTIWLIPTPKQVRGGLSFIF